MLSGHAQYSKPAVKWTTWRARRRTWPAASRISRARCAAPSVRRARGVTRQQAEQLAGQKEGEVEDLKQLEQEMQNAVRDLMGTQRQASTKLRNALGEIAAAGDRPRHAAQRRVDPPRHGRVRRDVRIQITRA